MTEDVHGHTGGQHDVTLTAREGDEIVGTLDYSVVGDKVHIKYVHSAVPKKGVGLAMFEWLIRKYGWDSIHPGMLTDSGAGLWAALVRRHGEQSKPAPVDYAALARKHGGVLTSTDPGVYAGEVIITVEFDDDASVGAFTRALKTVDARHVDTDTLDGHTWLYAAVPEAM